MLESLFGAETPLAVRFFIAFIVVFALIGVVAWLVRRFGSGALGSTSSRGRAPRLAVIEAGAVDGRRKLVLIRRDNVEHLIMIGGPTDIVVEQNIVRGQSSGRDVASARGTNNAESLPRAVPMGDDTNWPLQPEAAPAPRPARASRPAPAPAVEDTMQWSMPETVTPKRARPSDTLAGLAAELSPRIAAEPDITPARPAPKPEPRQPEPRIEAKIDVRPEPKLDLKPEQKFEPKFESKLDTKFEPKVEPKLDVRAPQPAAQPDSDQSLADMAQRLEAALRRPGAPAGAPAAAAPAPKPVAEKPAASEKPAAKPNNVFGSLEEEMASLLGRPPGKT